MRTAVISDIHGNATAFREVLRDIDACGIDAVICLGDNIGYGPEPETVVNMLRERDIASVMGNHEMVIRDPAFLEWFNPAARLSLEKTMAAISADNLSYLSGLPDFLLANEWRFVHGFPPDSPTKYMFEIYPAEMEKTMAEMTEPLCFIGHTHELALIAYRDASLKRIPIDESGRSHFLDPEAKYIVNAGSVGQPRDGTNEAKYVIFDNESYGLEIRHVPYDVNDTIKKIHAAGLPRQHALRLSW
ncbi:MAG: metallophosphoesterase family protein [Desulfosalsimonadaceae bacterium]